jgi:transcriptional regulator with XRE-family HTH domain
MRSKAKLRRAIAVGVRRKNVARQVMIAGRLKVARIALGKDKAQMARLLNISWQRWNNYEQGARPFDYDVAIELCHSGVTIDWLLRGLTESKVNPELLDALRAAEARVASEGKGKPRGRPTPRSKK